MSSNAIETTGQGEVHIGKRTAIGPGVQVVFLRPAVLSIGDYCSIAAGTRFVCDGGNISIGDWTTLHDRCLVMSTAGLSIGEHGWFGQQCVLDGTGGLQIGHGVRVGMYSQIWSHVAAGEQIEGCTLYGMRPVVLEDDVWLVGSCIVASGITLGRRTVALISSNITKSCPPFSVLAGSPATVKPGLSFYRDINRDEQWQLLKRWVDEIAIKFNLGHEQTADALTLRDDESSRVTFVGAAATASSWAARHPQDTVCCVETKTYTKQLTALEQKVLKALASNRARFRSNTVAHGGFA